MLRKRRSAALLAFFVVSLPLLQGNAAKSRNAATVSDGSNAVLWRDPVDIRSRDLFYGIGGEKDQPHAPYTFVEEDTDGTNPKYVIRDRDNVKWTVKLGIEARPETAASRLVWAAGYFTNEDYFLADLQVANMPAQLKRGRNLVARDGTMHNARLKRHLADEKTVGDWKWREAPFAGTREFSGLKVMMALVNNWDLKDVNNKVYAEKSSKDQLYEVSDIGATFGATGLSFPFSHSKDDLKAYARSKFIAKITSEYVDFRTPTRPALIYLYNPFAFAHRAGLDNLLHHVPRDDAKWMGHLLSGLSANQIHDAFRAAGYSTDETEAFSKVVQNRIAELNAL